MKKLVGTLLTIASLLSVAQARADRLASKADIQKLITLKLAQTVNTTGSGKLTHRVNGSSNCRVEIYGENSLTFSIRYQTTRPYDGKIDFDIVDGSLLYFSDSDYNSIRVLGSKERRVTEISNSTQQPKLYIEETANAVIFTVANHTNFDGGFDYSCSLALK